MAGTLHNDSSASSSSRPLNNGSSSSANSDPADRDELDFWSEDEDVADVLTEDPIREDLEEPLSFKRKQKQTVLSAPGRFLSAFTGSRSGTATPNSSPRVRTPTQDPNRSPRRADAHGNTNQSVKDGAPLDWYVEGPGRRVGYEDLTAIDWIFEYTKERQRLRVLHSSAHGLLGLFKQLLDSSEVWVILILTGMATGAVAAGIDITTDWLGDLKTGYCSSGPEGGAFYLNKNFCCWGYDEISKCAGWTPWAKVLGISSTGGKWFIEYFFFLILSVILASAAAILVKEYGMYAKHSGIPEIKTVLGGFIIRRFLGSWTLITKSLGLCLAVGSGMWLGKEGPLVHVACCCANLFIKLFKNVNENEAVVLQAFDPFRTGQLVMYQVKFSTSWHGFELIPFVLLGILGGIYGGLFIKANMAVARWKKNTSWLPGPITQVAAIALLTALINYPNHYMKFQTSELVSNLFVECSKYVDDQIGLCKTGAASTPTIVLLIFGAILGFFLATVTFGLQLPAGIILPSMAIGALTGRAVGIIMEIWVTNHPAFFPFASCEPDVPCVTPGTYAIIGAAATLAGVTRMTVSIVVIMFELTGALTYVLPIMIAVMISKWVGDAFSRKGIYEAWIHFNEYPFLDNSEEVVIPDIPASQIMTRIEDLVVITATGHTIGSLKNILDTHPYRGFPVISDPREALLLGYISRAELTYNLQMCSQPPRSLPPETEAFFSHQPLADPRTTLDLRPWMDQTPITMTSRSTLHLTVSYFQKLGLRYVLFSHRGALQGLLTKKDVWYVLNGAEETRRTSGLPRDMGVETGLTREDGAGEQRGLLRDDGQEDGISPADERETML
ncbi:voltage-gated chloride channel [Colletotrichum higginsianum]|nr:voltage-gated chloride channel [Colletotrichum higginsianum]